MDDCTGRSTTAVISLALPLGLLSVEAVEIAAIDYGLFPNGMPDTAVVENRFFKEESADVTGIVTPTLAGGATSWTYAMLTVKPDSPIKSAENLAYGNPRSGGRTIATIVLEYEDVHARV